MQCDGDAFRCHFVLLQRRHFRTFQFWNHSDNDMHEWDTFRYCLSLFWERLAHAKTRPSGPSMATCSNGQWYPSNLGTCSSNIIGGGIGGQCPALTTPPGGTLTMSSGYPGSPASSGTIATLFCPSGVQGKFWDLTQHLGGLNSTEKKNLLKVRRAYSVPMELGLLPLLEPAWDHQEQEVELLVKWHPTPLWELPCPTRISRFSHLSRQAQLSRPDVSVEP